MHTRLALITGLGLALVQAQAGTAAAAHCVQVGGIGKGVSQGLASYLAETAMMNSAKAKLGENARLGKVSKMCGWKTVWFKCTVRARACK
jgi:hypothetical protein